MKINEVFLSLQGEGRLLGVPAIFIRVLNCTLNCPYCDSKQASRCLEEPMFDINTPEEVIAFCEIVKNRYSGNECNNIIITGGEPLMKENWNQLKVMLPCLMKYGYHISFETSLIPSMDAFLKSNIVDTCNNFIDMMSEPFDGDDEFLFQEEFEIITVCPKLDTICYKEKVKEKQILDYYSFKVAEDVFFLMEDQVLDYKIVYYKQVEDMILKLTETFDKIDCFEIFKNRLYIMPFTPIGDNYNLEEWKKSCLETAEFCKRHGFRYSPRIHIDLYDLKRGV